MSSSNRRWLGGFVLAVVLVPSSASAQTLVQKFDELQRILKVGETVLVTNESGQEIKGKVADLSATSLVVVGSDDPLWNGTLIGLTFGVLPTFYCDDDPCPGAVVLYGGIGAAIGFLVDWGSQGLKGKWTFAEGTVSEIRRPDPLWNGTLIGLGVGVGLAAWGFNTGDNIVSGVAYVIPAVAGAISGALVDRALLKDRIRLAPQQTPRVTLSPLLGKDRQGVLVSVRF